MMKFTLSTLLLLILITSCEKQIDQIQPLPQLPVDSLPVKPLREQQISLNYLSTVPEITQFKLLVTDSSAKFLLDTILPVNVMHFLKGIQIKPNLISPQSQPEGLPAQQLFKLF